MLRFRSLLVFALILLLAGLFLFFVQRPLDEKIEKLDTLFASSLLNDFRIKPTQLRSESSRKAIFKGIKVNRLIREYEAPSRFSLDAVKKKLAPLADANRFELLKSDVVYGRTEKILSLDFGLSGSDIALYSLIFRQKILKRVEAKKEIPPLAIPKGKGALSVVIDDWGYSTHQLKKLGSLGVPVTIAVLPNLPYSGKAAQYAHEHGCEVIIHMPMEPHDEGVKPEKDTIYTSMDEKRVRQLLEGAIKSVPYAIGLNNHMGSKATEDARFMSVVFSHLKEKKFFFLDSFVTDRSVCGEEAERAGVGFAERDIFLDNSNEPSYIRSQLKEAASLAISKGICVAIGHDRPATLDVLLEMVQEMKRSGIEFVRLSELIKKD